MAASTQSNGLAKVLFEKAASIFTAAGFVAAAVFFVAVLWLPSQAASSSPAVPLETSLLLTMDKPQPPAPKMNLEPPSMADEQKELAFASRELASELNDWTFTASQPQSLLSAYVSVYQQYYSFRLSIFNQFLSYELALFRLELSFVLNIFNAYSNFFHSAISRHQ